MTPQDNEAQHSEDSAVQKEALAAGESTETQPDAPAKSEEKEESAKPETPSVEMSAPEPEKAAPTAEAPSTEAAPVEPESKPAAEKKEATETASDSKPSADDSDSEEPKAPDPKLAAALQESAARIEPPLRPGKRIKVTLVQIGEKDSFVDFGGRSEGTIATSELKNEQGEQKYNIGDEISAVVRKVGDTPVFTVGRRRVPANLGKAKEAFEKKIPLEGKVKATNKGGFEVDLHGVRAFCPYSQIQLGYCDKPEEYVGKRLPFLIVTFERGGRNIVVSRKNLLAQERKEAAKKLLENIEVGAVFDGVVRRLQPYGAFVDIGGLDGLIHVSEISHGRVTNPQDVLSLGQEVKVKVIKIEGEGSKQRISLSMKELEGDPWSEVAAKFPEGATVTGKVVRLADFGAFVELEPGVDGLIHVSEIAVEHVDHPSSKLQRGQELQVRVINVDPQQRRISLSLLSEEESQKAHARPPHGEHSGSDRGGRRSGAGQNRGDSAEHHRFSSPEKESEPEPDLTNMPFEDALEALKSKFRGD
ncbi:MAG TPA: S1 RNA-binding domain-containing protein [Candidatus Krumholzibacteria bacterium]|nr:S1 RNA-binding domain-containing protein [Candidatus Krumholzibacteria bacterium]